MRWLPKDEASNSAFFVGAQRKWTCHQYPPVYITLFCQHYSVWKSAQKWTDISLSTHVFFVCSKMVPFFQGNRIEIMRDTIFPIFCCLQTIKIGGRKNQCVHQLLPQVSVKVGLSLYFLFTSNFYWITRMKTRSMPCHHYTHTSLFLFGRKCEWYLWDFLCFHSRCMNLREDSFVLQRRSEHSAVLGTTSVTTASHAFAHTLTDSHGAVVVRSGRRCFHIWL